MEFVGRGVKKDFPERGTLLGVIQALKPATGRFKIVYEDGVDEELEWSEVCSVLVPTKSPGRNPTETDCLGKNWGCIVYEGNDKGNSLSGSGFSGRLVDTGECSRPLGINLNEGLDLNEDGLTGLNDEHSGGNVADGEVKILGFDLNKGVGLEFDEGVHMVEGVTEESMEAKKEMIDLNLDVNDDLEDFKDEKKARCFDLNLLLSEEGELRNVDCLGGQFGVNASVSAEGHMYRRSDGATAGNPMSLDGEMRNLILNMEKREYRPLENAARWVDNENLTPVGKQRKKRGRKRKDALYKDIEGATQDSLKVDFESGSTRLDLENGEEILLKNGTDSVDFDEETSEPVLKGRRGRKRKEWLDNTVVLATPATVLRRSSRRAKITALPTTDKLLDAAGLGNISIQMPSPAISVVSDEKITVTASGTSPNCSILPPKVELPPSCFLDLEGASVFDLFYVYSFLRSFSNFLLLSPFELDAFVASVKSNDSTLLFDSIHVSLLKTLRKHVETLSNEGSETASGCLRSLNWDYLDLITWPIFLLQYVLLHGPWYAPGCNLRQYKLFESDYYQLPVSAKVELLKHLCDDVSEGEAFRSDINRRELEMEQLTDMESNAKSDSSRRKKAAVDVASTSCVTEENLVEAADSNGDECHLCKMDGNLICCDGCPAAFHSRCVGVASSLLPEGHWYCPECAIEKDKPERATEKDKPSMKVRNSVRAEVLGRDPYGRLFHANCGYLFVLESLSDDYSSNAQYTIRLYNRYHLPKLLKVLESSPFIYDKIISAICELWDLVRGVNDATNDIDTGSHSIQSTFPQTKQLPDMNPTNLETLNNGEAFTEKRSEISVVTKYSSNLELENTGDPHAVLETDNQGLKMESHLASSEGSTEVSQTFIKTDIFKEIKLPGSERVPDIPDYCAIPRTGINAGVNSPLLTDEIVEAGMKFGLDNCGCGPYSINSKGMVSQVYGGGNYVNYYEFARTASSCFGELTCKSSDKSSDDSLISAEEIITRQLKVVTNRFAEFSWPNTQLSNLSCTKERCGWCFYCKAPEDGRDCLFIMNNSVTAIDNFTAEALGIQAGKNRKSNLIDVLCRIICLEDHLQGLLLGPWLNPHYSMRWRQSVIKATGVASVKNLLLKLESNLHNLALSTEWSKHVDSVATMGSACHIVRSLRASSRNGNGRKRAKSSDVSSRPSSNAATGLSLFWWRGGSGSRLLFKWKVLPRSLASKAARQGGSKKIPGILYPENGEYAKRTKCISWRARVETSRSVEQLALQVREFDANIRWDDISNTSLLQKLDKESNKSIKSFKKVLIRKKSSDGAVNMYLLDFGKRRFVPDVVVRHGSIVEDSTSLRKKYWLEESHLPLHLLKAFEGKRIARKSIKIKSDHEILTAEKKPSEKKGLAYLFSRLESSEFSECGHCCKDVRIRDAVTCEQCKGVFHKIHAQKSARAVIDDYTYTCDKCEGALFREINKRKEKSDSGKPENSYKIQKSFFSLKSKKKGIKKRILNSKSKKGATVVVPLRRSARYAERIAKASRKIANGKRRKKGRTESGKDIFKMPSSQCMKKRTPAYSSYWLNGLRLSRRPNDQSLAHWREKMLLVLSEQVISTIDKPKCSLCHELEYKPALNYVGCTICGVWFHGDALGLTADKLENVVGFKCHTCLSKSSPVCPHLCMIGSNNSGIVLGDNKPECT